MRADQAVPDEIEADRRRRAAARAEVEEIRARIAAEGISGLADRGPEPAPGAPAAIIEEPFRGAGEPEVPGPEPSPVATSDLTGTGVVERTAGEHARAVAPATESPRTGSATGSAAAPDSGSATGPGTGPGTGSGMEPGLAAVTPGASQDAGVEPGTSGRTSARGGEAAGASRRASTIRAWLASAVWLVAVFAALVLALAALFVALELNPDNQLVSAVLDLAYALDFGEFKSFEGSDVLHSAAAVRSALVNLGAAAVAWLVAGKVLDALIRPRS